MSPLPPVVATIEEVRQAVRTARADGQTIGLVPTMGALHEGHIRLIEACRATASFPVVSIFVNPTQFGPGEDFARYPRTAEADRERSAQGGAALIFSPSVETMYPNGPITTYVDVPGLSEVLEGASRPGHFRGVATIVLKLLQIVGPDRAYFGQKDYQQLQVVRRLVADLNVPVAIHALPTVREADGLAMSSRNRYLDPTQRRAATVLWRALQAAIALMARGERDADRVRQELRDTIQSEPLARLDYAEVADADSLAPVSAVGPGRRAVALVAAHVGPARLIDNALLPG